MELMMKLKSIDNQEIDLKKISLLTLPNPVMLEEIINLTKKAIIENKLDYKAPLYKEANTHIAVAILLTEYLV